MQWKMILLLLLSCALSVIGWKSSDFTGSLREWRLASRVGVRRSSTSLSSITGGGTSGVEDTSPITYSKNTTSILNRARILWRFVRPHTIKGTLLASIMGVSRALLDHPGMLRWNLVPRALLGLTALLCGNAYIVGINQIYDVQIDEINKPFLPVASKHLSIKKAWAIVGVSLITGFSIVATSFSRVILSLYSIGVTLGSLYSIPPIQLKRFPLAAGATIATVRGFLLNFGIYYAVREALEIPFKWNPVVMFISSMMTVFASIIAVTKDLPDIEGDRKYNITTFASLYGPKRIALLATIILGSAYLVCGLGLPYILYPKDFRPLPMVAGHLVALLYLLRSFRQLRPDDWSSIRGFYGAIWHLFYFEYCLYPFL